MYLIGVQGRKVCHVSGWCSRQEGLSCIWLVFKVGRSVMYLVGVQGRKVCCVSGWWSRQEGLSCI